LRITRALKALVILYAGFIRQANPLIKSDDPADNDDDDDNVETADKSKI